MRGNVKAAMIAEQLNPDNPDKIRISYLHPSNCARSPAPRGLLGHRANLVPILQELKADALGLFYLCRCSEFARGDLPALSLGVKNSQFFLANGPSSKARI